MTSKIVVREGDRRRDKVLLGCKVMAKKVADGRGKTVRGYYEWQIIYYVEDGKLN